MKTGAAALTSLAASSLKRAAPAAAGGAPAADFLHLIASTPSTARTAKTSKSAETNATLAAPASDARPVTTAAKTDKAPKSKEVATATGDVPKTADAKPDSGAQAAEIDKTGTSPAHEIAHDATPGLTTKPQADTSIHDSKVERLRKPDGGAAAEDGKADTTPKTITKPDAGHAIATADGTPETADDIGTLDVSPNMVDHRAAGDSANTPTEAAAVPAPVTRMSAKIAEKPKAERGDAGATTAHTKAADNAIAGDTTAAAAATAKTLKAAPVSKPTTAPNGKAADTDPVATTGEPVRIPAAMAAVFVAATGAAATASVTPATPADEPAAPIAKAKTTRETAAPSKKEARAETGEKAKPETDRSAASASNDSSAKPAERQPAATATTDLAPRENAIARAPSDPGTPVIAGDGKAGNDIRIHLPREASHPGATAPVVAVRVHAKDGVTRAIEIRLDPAELGQVDVRLETGHDGRLKAVVQADNPQTFELLKREGGILEAALRDAGVQLGDDGLSFTLGDQGTGSDSAHQRERSYAGAAGRREDAIQDVATATWRDGVIDISV